MSQNILLIIVAVGGLIFGFIFSKLDSMVTDSVTKKKKGLGEELKIVEKIVERPVEVIVPFSVSFDAQQQPVVKMDGQAIDAMQITFEQRRQLIEIISKIRPWIDPKAMSAQAAPPAPAQMTPPSSAQSVERPVVDQPSPMPAPPVAQPLPPLHSVTPQKEESNIKVPNIFQSAGAYMQTAVIGKAKVQKPLSIVEQIDAIIQERLENSPYKGQKISLTEGPDHLPQVIISGNRYPGIDAIPDPGIKAFIIECRDIWSQSQR
jgi:hypothetical protein